MPSDSSCTNKDLEKNSEMPASDPSDPSFQVSLDDHEDPQNMPSWRKWTSIVVLGGGALCATCLSSIVRLRCFSFTF